MQKRPTEKEFLKVYDSTMPQLYSLVFRWTRGRKSLSEDIVQETYLRALRTWERQGIPEDAGAWLRTVAKNLLMSHRRKSGVRAAGSIDLVPPEGPSPERRADGHLLRRALSRLQLSYRRVIEEFHFKGKSMREIAGEMGTTPRAVEGRLRRARKRLAEAMGIRSEGS